MRLQKLNLLLLWLQTTGLERGVDYLGSKRMKPQPRELTPQTLPAHFLPKPATANSLSAIVNI